jgi:hypothetical protein
VPRHPHLHSFGRSSLVKIAHLGRDPRCPKGKAPEQGGARTALDAKVLITLKVSNFDQTATKKRDDFTCKAAGAAPPSPDTPAARLPQPNSAPDPDCPGSGSYNSLSAPLSLFLPIVGQRSKSCSLSCSHAPSSPGKRDPAVIPIMLSCCNTWRRSDPGKSIA